MPDTNFLTFSATVRFRCFIRAGANIASTCHTKRVTPMAFHATSWILSVSDYDISRNACLPTEKGFMIDSSYTTPDCSHKNPFPQSTLPRLYAATSTLMPRWNNSSASGCHSPRKNKALLMAALAASDKTPLSENGFGIDKPRYVSNLGRSIETSLSNSCPASPA